MNNNGFVYSKAYLPEVQIIKVNKPSENIITFDPRITSTPIIKGKSEGRKTFDNYVPSPLKDVKNRLSYKRKIERKTTISRSDSEHHYISILQGRSMHLRSNYQFEELDIVNSSDEEENNKKPKRIVKPSVQTKSVKITAAKSFKKSEKLENDMFPPAQKSHHQGNSLEGALKARDVESVHEISADEKVWSWLENSGKSKKSQNPVSQAENDENVFKSPKKVRAAKRKNLTKQGRPKVSPGKKLRSSKKKEEVDEMAEAQRKAISIAMNIQKSVEMQLNYCSSNEGDSSSTIYIENKLKIKPKDPTARGLNRLEVDEDQDGPSNSRHKSRQSSLGRIDDSKKSGSRKPMKMDETENLLKTRGSRKCRTRAPKKEIQVKTEDITESNDIGDPFDNTLLAKDLPKMTVAFKQGDVEEWHPMKTQRGVMYSRTVKNEHNSCGFIQIQPQEILSKVSTNHQYYTLLKGKASWRNNNRDQVLNIGTCVFVPSGEEYIIKNKSNDNNVILSYFKFH